MYSKLGYVRHQPSAHFEIAIARNACALICFSTVLLVSVGCERGPQLVPVEGRVTYQGKPLQFGSVTFQPPRGQPAKGKIQPDGTFALSTFTRGDGAVTGPHKVRITCYESQRADATQVTGEQSLGASLIPRRYTFFDQSGLTAEVKLGGSEAFAFDLTD